MTINNIKLDDYLTFEGVKCDFSKKYDSENEFITEDGHHIKKVIGFQRIYSVNLSNVSEAVKNQLKTASLRGYVDAEIDGISGQFLLTNFSAALMLATDDLNVWNISFFLARQKIEVDDSSSAERTDYGIGIYDPNTGAKLARYSITNGDIIGSVKITSNAGGIPINGIYSSTLTFTVDKNCAGFTQPPTGAMAKIEGYDLQDFFIKSRTIKKNTASFTCSDRAFKLDQTFPVDDYFNSSTIWSNWNGSEVWMYGIAEAIAKFIGANWADTGDIDEQWNIPLEDLRGKTAREILQKITSRRGGIFVVRGGGKSGDGLKYIGPFSQKNTAIYTSNIRSEIVEGSSKGPITGVFCKNTETDATFFAGEVENPYFCLKLESKEMTQADADLFFERTSGKTYTGFSIQKIDLSTSDAPVLGYKIRPEVDSDLSYYYYPSNITISISATGPFASLSADDIVEDEIQFITDLRKEINKKLEANKNYNGVSIGSDGLKCEGTAGKITLADGTVHFYGTGSNEDYTFSTTAGGYTQYTGVMDSAKQAQSVVVDSENNTVTVTFSDGHVYSYSATVEQSDNTFSIIDEGSSWT